jgi:hypothetical protein
MLNAEIVRRLCGDILDQTVADILETGASVADVEAAMAWMTGETDAMGEARVPLSGLPAAVYDLLIVEQDGDDER